MSNEEHQARMAAKEHELLVAAAMLKQSEDTVDEVEAKLRKTLREKKFLSDELQEVVYCCCGAS